LAAPLLTGSETTTESTDAPAASPPRGPRLAHAAERLRTRPETLFVPFAAFWLLVNVGPWGFGTGYLVSFYLAFTLQKSNVIFPFTYAFAVLTCGAVLFAGLRWAGLGGVRAFLIAGTVPFAGPGAFEVVYQEAGAYFHPAIFVGYAQPYVMFSYGVWVVLGLTGLGWWRLTLRWAGVIAYTVAGFAVWFALGFPLVSMGSFAALPAAYLLNVSLKGSFYLVFVVPILEGMYAARSRPRASVPDPPAASLGPNHRASTTPSTTGPE
jgi:hypothetical protein